MPWTHYSARYTTRITAEKDEVLNFESEGNDGYRIKINDSTLVDVWERNRWGNKQFSFPVKKGQTYSIEMTFRQSEGDAIVKLRAGHYEKTDFNELARRFSDADIFCLPAVFPRNWKVRKCR